MTLRLYNTALKDHLDGCLSHSPFNSGPLAPPPGLAPGADSPPGRCSGCDLSALSPLSPPGSPLHRGTRTCWFSAEGGPAPREGTWDLGPLDPAGRLGLLLPVKSSGHVVSAGLRVQGSPATSHGGGPHGLGGCPQDSRDTNSREHSLGGAGVVRHPRGEHSCIWEGGWAGRDPGWHPAAVRGVQVACAGGRVIPAATWQLCSETTCHLCPQCGAGWGRREPDVQGGGHRPEEQRCRPWDL